MSRTYIPGPEHQPDPATLTPDPKSSLQLEGNAMPSMRCSIIATPEAIRDLIAALESALRNPVVGQRLQCEDGAGNPFPLDLVVVDNLPKPVYSDAAFNN